MGGGVGKLVIHNCRVLVSDRVDGYYFIFLIQLPFSKENITLSARYSKQIGTMLKTVNSTNNTVGMLYWIDME